MFPSKKIAWPQLCLSVKETKKNQRVIGLSGGVDQIVNAMKAFKENEKCLVVACIALRDLSFDAENRERLGINGGVVALVDSLASFSHDSVEIEHVLKALSNATFDHLENKQSVARCGGVDAIARIMSRTDQMPVYESGFRVLKNLTDFSADVRQLIMDSGALSTALTCLKSKELICSVIEQVLVLMLSLLIPSEYYSDEWQSQCLHEIPKLVTDMARLHPDILTIANLSGLIQTACDKQKEKRDGPSSTDFFRKQKDRLSKLLKKGRS